MILVAAVCLLRSGATATARESPAPTRIRVGLGFVIGGGGAVDEGLGLVTQVTYHERPHNLTLRWLGLWDFQNFPISDDDSISGLSLLYGRVTMSSWGHAALSTGLSYVGFDPSGSVKEGAVERWASRSWRRPPSGRASSESDSRHR